MRQGRVGADGKGGFVIVPTAGASKRGRGKQTS